MSDEDKHSKTEKPTDKRLKEAREKQSPPQSRDLTSVITLLAGIVALYSTGGFMFSTLQDTTRTYLTDMGTFRVTEGNVYSLMLHLLGTMGIILCPFLLTVMVAGVSVNFAQGGITLSWQKIANGYQKMNPLQGAKKLFNKDALMEIVKATLKISIVGYVSYRVIRGQADTLAHLSDQDIGEIFGYIGWILFKLVVNSCGVLLVLAVLDLAFVKWRYLQNLRMTKQEVKQEAKDSEGDPQVKGKIRRFQFEQSRKRLMQIVPTADVVITNPTHFAVCLKYDRDRMAAPIVIAKGADNMALRIKEIARNSKVMLVENRFLARELYASVKEGQEIPESLYAAVAQVLAYVFRLKGKL
jgi:flagellar biosynthetic protein FlhB